MRMVYVGTLDKTPDRDSCWIREFKDLGWTVIPFSSKVNPKGVSSKIQRRFGFGKYHVAQQNNLIDYVKCAEPNWVHFRLPLDYDRQTIAHIKSKNIIVTQYFNDDPFSRGGPFGLHWTFCRAIDVYDAHFVFRETNVSAFRNKGAKHVEYCPPFYDQQFQKVGHRHVSGDFIADAAFIGHWENDGRVDVLNEIYSKGFSVILKGRFWDPHINGKKIGALAPVTGAYGADYNNIYANVMVGICFFSKINNDTWTRRALEIPAVGGLLACERTLEAKRHFRDREEAFFFSSTSEILDILRELRGNLPLREKVTQAGHKRLVSGSNTISDRAKQINSYILGCLKA